MKKLTLLVACAITFIFTSVSFKAKAYQYLGGDIFYQWLSDSTYRFYVRTYVGCSGISEPSSLSACLKSSCSSSSIPLSMSSAAGSIEVPAPCPSSPTKCTTPSSTLPGYKTHTYFIDITLPNRCNFWTFAAYDGSGLEIALNLGSGMNLYLETTFNNTGTFQGNSSPTFSQNGLTYVCNSIAAGIDIGVTDSNGDSVSTEVVQPYASGSCSSITTMPFASTTPALSISKNPFQTNNSFKLNASGQMSFTPGQIGSQLLMLRTSEYRSGVLIGYTMRNMRIGVTNCSALSPASGTTLNYTGTISTTGGISGCPGQSLGFSVDIKKPATAYLFLTDNHTLVAPGSTVIYSPQGKDSIRATFNWTPPSNFTGITELVFSVKDSTCPSNGFILNTAVIIPITIWGKPKALNDTAICVGANAYLAGNGGANYLWSLISGTTGSLSCTACSNPIANPNTTSSYLLTSITSAFCGNNTDTVTVTVNPATTPSVSITATPGTYVTQGTNVVFSATTTNCSNPAYIWKLNGNVMTGITGSSFNTSTLKTNDIITCQISCSDPCPNPSNPSSNQITMQVIPLGISHTNVAATVNIYPNPNNGIFTIEITPGIAERCRIEVINILGETMYRENETLLTGKKQLNLSHLPSGVYTIKLNEVIQHIAISK